MWPRGNHHAWGAELVLTRANFCVSYFFLGKISFRLLLSALFKSAFFWSLVQLWAWSLVQHLISVSFFVYMILVSILIGLVFIVFFHKLLLKKLSDYFVFFFYYYEPASYILFLLILGRENLELCFTQLIFIEYFCSPIWELKTLKFQKKC